MTKPPELPIIDGAIFVDNSALELLQTCPRSFEYSYLNRRISSGDRPALNFGSAIHEALRYRYERWGHSVVSDPQGDISNLLADFFSAHPQSEADYRDLTYATKTIEAYNRFYCAEPFGLCQNKDGKPLVEKTFSFELGQLQNIKIIYTGRIDLAFTNNEGEWIMDHKTTSVFGQQFEDDMAASAQMRGYCMAYWQVFGRRPRGYYVNAIRTRPPLKKDAIDDFLGTKKPGRDDNFKRLYWHVTEDDLMEWKRDTLQQVSTFLYHHSNDFFPRHKKWCVGKYGRCPYYDLCSVPASQRSGLLQSSLFVDNTWSPLNVPKPLPNVSQP